MELNYKLLFDAIFDGRQLPRSGIHGISHWTRVFENGMKLAQSTGANLKIVELFALFHDSRRINDGFDPGHGKRGAELARKLNDEFLHLDSVDLELLCFSCSYHTDGLIKADITAQTCWDADRLDLGRVNIIPNPDCLCTPAAKETFFLEEAYSKSISGTASRHVSAKWGL